MRETEELTMGNGDIIPVSRVFFRDCPPELLKMILERGCEDRVSRRAAEHPNCPPETLKMILEKGNEGSVSQYAACELPRAKAPWLLTSTETTCSEEQRSFPPSEILSP